MQIIIRIPQELKTRMCTFFTFFWLEERTYSRCAGLSQVTTERLVGIRQSAVKWCFRGRTNSHSKYIDKDSIFSQVTPDRNFVIDRHPRFHNIIVGAGFSGWCSCTRASFWGGTTNLEVTRVHSGCNKFLVLIFAGHGFKMAPVVGKILSQIALGEQTSYNIAPFRISRLRTPGLKASL